MSADRQLDIESGGSGPSTRQPATRSTGTRSQRSGTRRSGARRLPRLEDEILALGLPEAKTTYLLRSLSYAQKLRRQDVIRYFATGATWTLTLLLGAAVPVAELVDAPSVVSSSLGLGVVTSHTLQRLYLRVSKSSPAEAYVRGVQAEIRSLLAFGATADKDEAFQEFFVAVEKLRKEFDEKAAAHNAALFGE